MEAIFLFGTLMKKQPEEKNLCMIFIYLEKAYGKVPIDIILWILNKRSVPRGYNVIIDMYEAALAIDCENYL